MELSSVLSAITAGFYDIIYSPLNLLLLSVCVYLIYKFIIKRDSEENDDVKPSLPKMKRRDFTVDQLLQYNGLREDGRILIAINGNVFDCSRGYPFYGPDGPYGSLAGHDATRALATFSIDSVKDEHDDVSDLKATELESATEWEMQFREKYDHVGKLLKPGETPAEYSDADEEGDASKLKSS